ncbi:hypothetical protein Bca52824_074022 [Brassica carinata]|uniref:Uncharacterized protein n=2 Tax=Brassica TaxID=3705 RepID=A0ABQ7EKS1_BRACR|nr:hypothetical protein DY000_02020430 [Brassica cretica]KAG2266943.1 hypothetical protein Bca52824_074022 [Brassica carinata]
MDPQALQFTDLLCDPNSRGYITGVVNGSGMNIDWWWCGYVEAPLHMLLIRTNGPQEMVIGLLKLSSQ